MVDTSVLEIVHVHVTIARLDHGCSNNLYIDFWEQRIYFQSRFNRFKIK